MHLGISRFWKYPPKRAVVSGFPNGRVGRGRRAGGGGSKGWLMLSSRTDGRMYIRKLKATGSKVLATGVYVIISRGLCVISRGLCDKN